MVRRSSRQRQRDLREFGEHLRRWRRVNGLSATQVAERASITRETLRNIEHGTGTARLDSVFAVLAALGITDAILRGANPYNSEAARARIDDIINGGGEL
ncbi:helix-turn-helix domain-containing protein [Microbacterium sp. 18062]|uniref:helix-turn-helix domain-containing protein n=1 Tax=Microbacterium sp. 18062 TaxID=2681410 RepID=UPI00135C95DE|nr:helix-turn-helix transcriptional regulator [Microbacterium sp. 18062]